MISWGIVVILTAAASGAFELAILRFVLGIAEAGFFPGLILYLTAWFRQRDLAQAVALFMTALAVSNIVGGPVSTWILDNIAWANIAGWRWLFIIEGIPAIVLGVVTWLYLTDRPEDARWLDEEEKAWLAGELGHEEEVRDGVSTQDPGCSHQPGDLASRTGLLHARDRPLWHRLLDAADHQRPQSRIDEFFCQG